jgi:hypothetical protein
MTRIIALAALLTIAATQAPRGMSITAYAPDSGDGISGSGTMADGRMLFVGAAACPARLRFGTRVTLTGRAALRARALGLPIAYECADRFRDATREDIDIAIPVGYRNLSNAERIELARVWGNVWAVVVAAQ